MLKKLFAPSMAFLMTPALFYGSGGKGSSRPFGRSLSG